MPRRSAWCQIQTHARQHIPSLFDHLVGAGEERVRHGNAKRFGGFEIDDKLEFGRLVDWQVVRRGALENAAGLYPCPVIGVRNAVPVTDESAGHDEGATKVDRRQRVMRRLRDDLIAAAEKERISAHDSAPARRSTAVAKAASISVSERALTTCSCHRASELLAQQVPAGVLILDYSGSRSARRW